MCKKEFTICSNELLCSSKVSCSLKPSKFERRLFFIKVLRRIQLFTATVKKKFPLHRTDEEQRQRMENVWKRAGPACKTRSDKITLLLETSFLVFCSLRSPVRRGKNFLLHIAQSKYWWKEKKRGQREKMSRHIVSYNLVVSNYINKPTRCTFCT